MPVYDNTPAINFREADLSALERAKEMERKLASKLVARRLDTHTIQYSLPNRKHPKPSANSFNNDMILTD